MCVPHTASCIATLAHCTPFTIMLAVPFSLYLMSHLLLPIFWLTLHLVSHFPAAKSILHMYQIVNSHFLLHYHEFDDHLGGWLSKCIYVCPLDFFISQSIKCGLKSRGPKLPVLIKSHGVLHVCDWPVRSRVYLIHESWRGKHITTSSDASLSFHSCDYHNKKVIACCQNKYGMWIKAWRILPTWSQSSRAWMIQTCHISHTKIHLAEHSLVLPKKTL